MKKTRLFSLSAVALFVALALPACAPAVVGSRLDVPKDSAATCTNFCHDLGLPLESVVIMASTVGCVCRARDGAAPPVPSSPNSGPSAASGGMAAVMIAAAQAEQQRQMAQHR